MPDYNDSMIALTPKNFNGRDELKRKTLSGLVPGNPKMTTHLEKSK